MKILRIMAIVALVGYGQSMVAGKSKLSQKAVDKIIDNARTAPLDVETMQNEVKRLEKHGNKEAAQAVETIFETRMLARQNAEFIKGEIQHGRNRVIGHSPFDGHANHPVISTSSSDEYAASVVSNEPVAQTSSVKKKDKAKENLALDKKENELELWFINTTGRREGYTKADVDSYYKQKAIIFNQRRAINN